MRNAYKYTRMYSGSDPQFVEGDVFKTIIPLTEVATATVGPEVITPPDEEINGVINPSPTEQKLLVLLKTNPRITKQQMSISLGIGSGSVERALINLKNLGLI